MPWTKQKAKSFEADFREFLSVIRIDSKEGGGSSKIVLYEAQERFLRALFDGLVKGRHSITVLKARQLGLTTISFLLSIFWCAVFTGIRGAVIFDDDKNKEEFRTLFLRAIESLPRSHEIKIEKHDRYGISFGNGSRLSYLVAGVRKSKTSGSLGRSRGLNFVFASEMCSWGSMDGIVSLKRSLAQKYEDRLFIWESTARGFNLFHDMWEEAEADDLAQTALFVGWWSKEDYRIERSDPLFERYGQAQPSKDEQEKIDEVQSRYGHTVTMEQLAWYRHEYDPHNAIQDDDEPREDDELLKQELPWLSEDAFVMTGSQFFPGFRLTSMVAECKRSPFEGYRYFLGADFLATMVTQVKRYVDAQLKIWEEPDPSGVYVVGADPAYGASDSADRYCAQILRCYADGVDQVAEFCVRDMQTYQFTWVLAHLCGLYANARLIIEINGPGESVWNEFRVLEMMLQNGLMKDDAVTYGVENMFRNVRHYLFRRRDSLGGAFARQLKTNSDIKVNMMHKLRDMVSLEQVKVRSLECINEMKAIRQDGAQIEAEAGKKDDRVLALAIAIRAWEDQERDGLVAQRRTREIEMKRKTATPGDMWESFMGDMMSNIHSTAQKRVRDEKRAARRGSRWNW